MPWLPKNPSTGLPDEPRRMFMAGGSDAHGDFNYRREGYTVETTAIVDTALGKPRNMLFAGDPTTVLAAGLPPVYGPGQVRDAVEAGHFSVTDGPALRIGVDTNESGFIDGSDGQMGDYVVVTDHATLPVIVEWASTPEFGPVERIELTVGVSDPLTRQSRLYTGGPGTTATKKANTGAYLKNGVSYSQDERGYWNVGSPQVVGAERLSMLAAVFPAAATTPADYMRGQRTFTLDLSKLELPQGFKPSRIFVRAVVFTARENKNPAPFCFPGTPPPWQPPCDDCGPTSESGREGKCIHRYAFSNPVWVRNKAGLVTHP